MNRFIKVKVRVGNEWRRYIVEIFQDNNTKDFLTHAKSVIERDFGIIVDEIEYDTKDIENIHIGKIT